MKKAWGFIAVSAVVFAICCYHFTAKDSFLHKQDFNGCELYIHNWTCSTLFEVRTVDDDDLCDEIVELCLGAEPFRPSVLADQKTGASGPYVRLENEICAYTIDCIDAEEQLDIRFIHRDKPVIGITKSAITEYYGHKTYKTEWGWLCTLSPTDYALLYELLQTYADGEIIVL